MIAKKNMLNFNRLQNFSLRFSLQRFRFVFMFAKKNKLTFRALQNFSLLVSLLVCKLYGWKFSFPFSLPKVKI